ncbi:uncharacterized protein LOC141908713 isoform X2 [Tubulanus polymorphus]|uniref:uncharacterized protein LOC141908713 isoform X2 n=1 Tax=Tubulanus polymorphus TaxID=672921 RepID=UPI003DA41F61
MAASSYRFEDGVESASGEEHNTPTPGKVNQDNYHYDYNRENRRTIRQDIIDAKIAQHEEELKEQEEAMRQLEEKRRQAEEDEMIAKQVMEDLERKEREEQHNMKLIANQDEQFAKQLQEKERRRYEHYLEKRKARELARERRRLERSLVKQHKEIQGLSSGINIRSHSDGSCEPGGIDAGVRLRAEDGKFEDVGDFSDFYAPPPPGLDEEQIRILQEQQDGELAKLLQEQEHKRGAQVGREKFKDIESKDAELAAIIQKQENVKLNKLRMKMKNMSTEDCEYKVRQHPPERSVGVPEYHHYAEPLYHELHSEAQLSKDWQVSQKYQSSLDNQQPKIHQTLECSPGINTLPNSSLFTHNDQLSCTPPPPRGMESDLTKKNVDDISSTMKNAACSPMRYSQHTANSGISPRQSSDELLDFRSVTPDEVIDESAAQITTGPTPTYNIAAMLDPTFRRRVQNHHHSLDSVERLNAVKYGASETDVFDDRQQDDDAAPAAGDDDDDDGMVAVQGQRRKSDGKRDLDGKRGSCKQQ